MRPIAKRQNAPESFRRWLTPPSDNPGWRASWEAFADPQKAHVSASLLQEQGRICCYCGWRIGLTGTDHHIEHLSPGRAPNDAGALDYRNMLASCGPRSVPKRQQHCGEHKGSERLPITPLDPQCPAYFRYAADGRMVPGLRGQDLAIESIRVLNLNAVLLAGRRRAIMRAVEAMDAAELSRALARCTQAPGGVFEEFCFVTESAVRERLNKRPPAAAPEV
jgi:uncharacterized protein (TIGR02646 family)